MIPLCTTASVPSDDVCGCAFTSVGGPCVAHRVCAIPSLPFGAPPPLHAFARFDTLPAVLTNLSTELFDVRRGRFASGCASELAPSAALADASPCVFVLSSITASPAES